MKTYISHQFYRKWVTSLFSIWSALGIAIGAPETNEKEKPTSGDGDAPQLTDKEILAVVKIVVTKERTHRIEDAALYAKLVELVQAKPDLSPEFGVDTSEPWVYCDVAKPSDHGNNQFSLTLLPDSYLIRIFKCSHNPKNHTSTSVDVGWYRSPVIWKIAKEAVLRKVKHDKENPPIEPYPEGYDGI